MSDANKLIVNRVSAVVNALVVLLVLLGVYIGVNWNRMPGGVGGFLAVRVTIKNLLVSTFFLASCAATFCVFGLTNPSRSASFWKEIVKVTKACSVTAVFAWIFPLTSHSSSFTGQILLYFLPAAIIACLCGRFVACACMVRLIQALNGHGDLIIVGSGPRAANLYSRVREPGQGYTRVLGFVDSPNGHTVPAEIQRQMLGSLEELDGILMRQPVDEVLIALPAKSCYSEIQTAIRTCERAGVEAKYLFDVFQFSLSRPRLEHDDRHSVVSLKVEQDDYRLWIKRCLDIVGSLIGIVVLGPLMLAIAAAIRLTSSGPALYTQERCGWHKRPFRVYKFRTMAPNADQVLANYLEMKPELGHEWLRDRKLRNDPRVTRLGRILRKTSMDELPQLFNVLRGQMSLVGPRPIVDGEVSKYGESFGLYRQMTPGLTGLWQVSGRNNCSYQERVEFDKYYVQNWSLRLDMRLLARTVKVLVTGHGAY